MVDKKIFRTPKGVSFTVLESKFYPTNKVAKQYRRYLGRLRPNFLVGVKLYGVMIPVITGEKGVTRLAKIKIETNNTVPGCDTVYNKPSLISKALGIQKPKSPLSLIRE